MSREPLRVAVLGTGATAQIIHLPILKTLPGARIHALCDLDHDKARALAERLGVPRVLRRDEEVFRADDIEAVVIASPSHLHQEQVVAALEAGKHVLVERPLALDARGAEAAVKAAERAGRTLAMAYNNRYRPEIRGLKSFVASGELGDVFSVHGTWFNRKVRPKRLTWRHRKATAGGGAFMDLGLQVLDLCLWMLDYPPVDRVCAHTHPGEGMEVEDSASALFRLTSGGAVSVQVTWSLLGRRDRHHVRLFGTSGSASTQPLKVFKEVEHGVLDVTPQIVPTLENAYMASYREELRQFVSAATGPETPPPPREQVQLMRLARLVYESAEKAREMRL